MTFRSMVFWIAVLCCLCQPAAARTPPLPKTADTFTDFMADMFADAMPDSKVSVQGLLTLRVKQAGRGEEQVRLNTVWDECEQDRRRCRKAAEEFVANMQSTMKESANLVIKPENIRVVVRGERYIADMRRIANGDRSKLGVMRPIAGDLWAICVIDMSRGIQVLNAAQAAKLKLTDDQAIALGIKNVAAALPPLAEHTHDVKDIGLKLAFGDFYESSRMLLHGSWAGLSKAMGGHLVIAVPSADAVIYGNGGGKGDRILLGSFARTMFEKAPKSLSASLFHWTPTGWEVVKAE